jgi:isoamylase
MMNAYWEPLDFELPSDHRDPPWRRWIDTSLDSPDDIVEWHMARPVTTATYRVEAHSVVVLFAGAEGVAA